jgi:hypothetical protein
VFKLNLAEREKKIRKDLGQLIYFNADTDIKSFSRNPALISALFLDSLTPAQLLQLVLRSEISHVMQNSFEPIEDKLDLIKRLDLDYMKFYSTEFNILNTQDTVVELFSFSRIEAKENILQEIFSHFNIDQSQPRNFNLVSVLSEMVMNAQAISDVFKDAANTEVIKVLVEKNDDVFAFSVFDNAGALSFSKFLKKIESTSQLGYRESINFGRGGAGIGTSIIYNNSESLFLSCKQGVVTRVTAIVPYNKRQYELEHMQKSIHIIRNLVKVKGGVFV